MPAKIFRLSPAADAEWNGVRQEATMRLAIDCVFVHGGRETTYIHCHSMVSCSMVFLLLLWCDVVVTCTYDTPIVIFKLGSIELAADCESD